MFLAIDIGNTNVTLGVYQGEQLAATWRIATVHDRMADEYGILLTQLLSHRDIRIAQVAGIAIAATWRSARETVVTRKGNLTQNHSGQY